MNLNQKLSNNFTLWECIRSETASRHNIDNVPPEKLIPKLEFFCKEILQPVRDYYDIPFRPNSVYRCLELNRKIGSKDTSQHLQAEAGDIEVPTISNYDLAVWIKNHLTFDQLILECYVIGQLNSGWVHVSIKQKNNRGRVLTYSKGNFISGLIA